jgi:hypothetical protein
MLRGRAAETEEVGQVIPRESVAAGRRGGDAVVVRTRPWGIVVCFEQIDRSPLKAQGKTRTHARRNAMQEFVRKQNILEFRKLLLTATDKNQRRMLLRLLAEEEAKAPSLLNARARDSDD